MLRRHLARRLASVVPVLVGITVISFAMVRCAPGGPFAPAGTMRTSPETIERLRAMYGLDQPLAVQYVRWLMGLARGRLGESLLDGAPVAGKIRNRFTASAQLAGFAIVFSLLLGVPLGMAAGERPGSRFDLWTQAGLMVLLAVPGFWLGYLMVALCVRLWGAPVLGAHGMLPVTASWSAVTLDRLRHMVLPGVALGLPMLVVVARYTRTAAVEQGRQLYIQVARAKGLSWSTVVVRHWLPNCLLPVVAVLSVGLPELLAGSVLVETVFAWPGLGRLGYEAVLARDYPVIMGITTLAAFLVVAAGLLADVAYALLDPRIRVGGATESGTGVARSDPNPPGPLVGGVP